MRYFKKILVLCFICLLLVSISYSHSGRTDSNGGHRDNQNKSGLGNYHYHCGGNPAHLHNNGICPYSINKESNINVIEQEDIKQTIEYEKDKEVEIEKIKIINSDENIYVGEYRMLRVEYIPDNANREKITWKSSNDDIASIDNNGKVFAKKTGIVTFLASTENNIKTSVVIIIKDKVKENKLMEVKRENNIEEEGINSFSYVLLIVSIIIIVFILYNKKHK